jgi:hypothetical protein
MIAFAGAGQWDTFGARNVPVTDGRYRRGNVEGRKAQRTNFSLKIEPDYPQIAQNAKEALTRFA